MREERYNKREISKKGIDLSRLCGPDNDVTLATYVIMRKKRCSPQNYLRRVRMRTATRRDRTHARARAPMTDGRRRRSEGVRRSTGARTGIFGGISPYPVKYLLFSRGTRGARFDGSPRPR